MFWINWISLSRFLNLLLTTVLPVAVQMRIVLPDSAQDKPQRGEVVAIGDGHVNDMGEKVALTVKEGDKVLFSSYAGDEISVGDEDYLLLRESDILATV